jgi:lipoprotein-anchoring transpeptidase ErfK/SrfK
MIDAAEGRFSRPFKIARESFMRRGHAMSLGSGLACSALALSVSLAAADPSDLVVPGYYPAPAAPASSARPGAYGGGFIEFLATRNRGQGALYNEPPEAAPAYGAALAPAYANGPNVASLEPARADLDQAASGEFARQEVAYDGRERPGVLIIDTPRKFLFLVQPNRRAIRYGIGVGRPGFEWSGVKTVSRKAEWPGWTPPPEMLLRRPDLPDHMDGGPGNPLGARALYLGSSMYRIHGTNEPATIGQNVSSGCIRMMNRDVIDLYNRVPVGAKVIVI